MILVNFYFLAFHFHILMRDLLKDQFSEGQPLLQVYINKLKEYQLLSIKSFFLSPRFINSKCQFLINAYSYLYETMETLHLILMVKFLGPYMSQKFEYIFEHFEQDPHIYNPSLIPTDCLQTSFHLLCDLHFPKCQFIQHEYY